MLDHLLRIAASGIGPVPALRLSIIEFRLVRAGNDRGDAGIAERPFERILRPARHAQFLVAHFRQRLAAHLLEEPAAAERQVGENRCADIHRGGE